MQGFQGWHTRVLEQESFCVHGLKLPFLTSRTVLRTPCYGLHLTEQRPTPLAATRFMLEEIASNRVRKVTGTTYRDQKSKERKRDREHAVPLFRGSS
jgi:hypothetical protein